MYLDYHASVSRKFNKKNLTLITLSEKWINSRPESKNQIKCKKIHDTDRETLYIKIKKSIKIE